MTTLWLSSSNYRFRIRQKLFLKLLIYFLLIVKINADYSKTFCRCHPVHTSIEEKKDTRDKVNVNEPVGNILTNNCFSVPSFITLPGLSTLVISRSFTFSDATKSRLNVVPASRKTWRQVSRESRLRLHFSRSISLFAYSLCASSMWKIFL